MATVSFSVASWNILAENYCHPTYFPAVPAGPLRWNARKDRINDVLRELNADLLSLQEVDPKEDVLHMLALLGYDYVWAQRGVNERAGKPDGEVLAWKVDRFSRVPRSHVILDYDDLAQHFASKAQRRRFQRHNVGHFLLLKHKGESESEGDGEEQKASGTLYVLFGGTHLYWDPTHPDVKLVQSHYLVRAMQEARDLHLARLGPKARMAVLITGDFNSQPRSAVYRFLTQGGYALSTKRKQALIAAGEEEAEEEKKGEAKEAEGERKEIPAPVALQRADSGLDGKDLRLTLFRSPSTPVLLDFHLFKVSVWLRALGVDSMAQTKEMPPTESEELFKQAVNEHRLILTASHRLVAARNTPLHLLLERQTSSDPHWYLRQILTALNFDKAENWLEPSQIPTATAADLPPFQSRCISCNCELEILSREARASTEGVPPDLRASLTDREGKEVECYKCRGCSQVFWWGVGTDLAHWRFRDVWQVAQDLRLRGLERAKAEAQAVSLPPNGTAAASPRSEENGNGDVASGPSELALSPSAATREAEGKKEEEEAEEEEDAKEKGQVLSSRANGFAVAGAMASRFDVLRDEADSGAEEEEEEEEAGEEEEGKTAGPPSFLPFYSQPTGRRRGGKEGKRDWSLLFQGPFQHDLNLTSAYANYRKEGEPEFTNFTHTFDGCIDYIFVSREASTPEAKGRNAAVQTPVAVSNLRPLPERSELAAVGGLPSASWPSDHLALMCTLTVETQPLPSPSP